MAEKTDVQYKGVGFFGLLTIVFIVLKLIDVIQWSWVWVLAPTWMPVGIAIICIGFAFILALGKVSKTTYKKEAKLA